MKINIWPLKETLLCRSYGCRVNGNMRRDAGVDADA